MKIRIKMLIVHFKMLKASPGSSNLPLTSRLKASIEWKVSDNMYKKKKTKKKKKNLWLRYPIQLFTNVQWWSKPSTHLLQ